MKEAGVWKLYRSAEGMREARVIKPTKARAYFTSHRGAVKVSVGKDFPVSREI